MSTFTFVVGSTIVGFGFRRHLLEIVLSSRTCRARLSLRPRYVLLILTLGGSTSDNPPALLGLRRTAAPEAAA
jgi:hypothetical protein